MSINESAPGLRAQDQGANDHLAGGSFDSVPPRWSVRQMLTRNPYGLSLREVRAEMRRCAARGWQLWELRARFLVDEGSAFVTQVQPSDQAFSRVREATGEVS